MIRCLIVDDEPLARKLLEEFILKTPGLSLVATAQSALAAREILSQQKVDVIFLDIQMPDLTGIDFLKTVNKRPLVVFTTAYAEYALEGFELDVVDYLLKPFDFNRFLKAVNKITDRHSSPEPVREVETTKSDFIFVKDGGSLVRIDLSSIYYIKGSREYVTIVSTQGKVMSLLSLKNLESELPDNFIRIHNSFIVRLAAIQSVDKDDVYVNGEALPIGPSYKKLLLAKIGDYLKG